MVELSEKLKDRYVDLAYIRLYAEAIIEAINSGAYMSDEVLKGIVRCHGDIQNAFTNCAWDNTHRRNDVQETTDGSGQEEIPEGGQDGGSQRTAEESVSIVHPGDDPIQQEQAPGPDNPSDNPASDVGVEGQDPDAAQEDEEEESQVKGPGNH